MSDTYFDHPEKFDWEQGGLPGRVRAYAAVRHITCTHNEGGICYELEATGLYSCGQLISVSDVEIVGTEIIGKEPEDG